jgi:hypothetical protein
MDLFGEIYPILCIHLCSPQWSTWEKNYLQKGCQTGDPLSPLLFVNTSELLQFVNNDAWSRGEINLPIEEDFGQKYPILQYADNSIMIMLADQTQLLHLKEY